MKFSCLGGRHGGRAREMEGGRQQPTHTAAENSCPQEEEASSHLGEVPTRDREEKTSNITI